MIERFNFPNAAEPRGPYSHAVRAGDFIFVSGQVCVDRDTNQYAYGTIEEETRRVLDNISVILEGAGATMADVVKCSVFLKNGADFLAMNEVYSEFFGNNKPARSTVVVDFANPLIKVEIDCIAYKPKA